MNENFEINIACFYPELLNIYGDKGNILTLEKRLTARDIKVNICKISLNSEINFDKFDIFYIGGGENEQQKTAAKELLKYKNNFQKIKENNKTVLGICGGYQILGKYFEAKDEKIEGLGLLNCYTLNGEKRHNGNVTSESNLFMPSSMVGFENHSRLTFLEEGTKPLAKVITGTGNNTDDNTEGAVCNNIIGTYLHGPVLPKNASFCDYLLQNAIRIKLNDSKFELSPTDNTLEDLTHQNLLQKAY